MSIDISSAPAIYPGNLVTGEQISEFVIGQPSPEADQFITVPLDQPLPKPPRLLSGEVARIGQALDDTEGRYDETYTSFMAHFNAYAADCNELESVRQSIYAVHGRLVDLDGLIPRWEVEVTRRRNIWMGLEEQCSELGRKVRNTQESKTAVETQLKQEEKIAACLKDGEDRGVSVDDQRAAFHISLGFDPYDQQPLSPKQTFVGRIKALEETLAILEAEHYAFKEETLPAGKQERDNAIAYCQSLKDELVLRKQELTGLESQASLLRSDLRRHKINFMAITAAATASLPAGASLELSEDERP